MIHYRTQAIAQLIVAVIISTSVIVYGLYKASVCIDKGGVFVQWRCVQEVK